MGRSRVIGALIEVHRTLVQVARVDASQLHKSGPVALLAPDSSLFLIFRIFL